ncbi:MAG: hypothetical protein QXQ53_01205 [Candidatus Methanosuratincola sp.]
MIRVSFLKPQQFDSILPVVKKFAEKTKTPFYQHINEVALSLMEPSFLTIVAENDTSILGYACGYFLNQTDFLLSQAYSTNHVVTNHMRFFLENYLVSLGTKRIFALFSGRPKVTKRHGFKIARYIVEKTLQ